MDKSAPSKWALEKAAKLRDKLEGFIDRDGEWDTASQADSCIAIEFDSIRRERDEVTEKLAKALDFMYRYFVMPGHPERAKDCPNKDCPFCKADEALAAYRERMGR